MCIRDRYLPSRPKKGESLMVNNMLMVGSSIAIGANASGFSKSAIVSPISNPSIPTSAHISPHSTSSTFCLPIPSNVIKSLIRVLICVTPSLLHNVTGMPDFKVPRVSFPIAIRPTSVSYTHLFYITRPNSVSFIPEVGLTGLLPGIAIH